MANSTVYHLGGADGESFSTKRRTGWIPLTDMSRNTTIRRFNARYKSPESVTTKIYVDGDDTNPFWQKSLYANNGESGALLSDVNHMNSTTTTLPTLSTTKLHDDDWIKIDNEIMKIITAGTTSHTVERGGRGTTATTHNNNSKIYYANYQNNSCRVSRRANSIMVEVSTSASTSTGLEIGKLEVEVDGR